MQGGWVYILTNEPFGPLYIGVTADIVRRMAEHKAGHGTGFATKYRLRRLVLVEFHSEIALAIQREKSMKRWPRDWKLNAIVQANPEWVDLTFCLE